MKRPAIMRTAGDRIPFWIHATGIGAITGFFLVNAYMKDLASWLPPYLPEATKAVAALLGLLYFLALSARPATRIVEWMARRFPTPRSLLCVLVGCLISYVCLLAAYAFVASELLPQFPEPIRSIFDACVVVGFVYFLVFGFALYNTIRDRWPDGVFKPERRDAA